MKTREDLHAKFEEILGPEYKDNVYFQPTTNIRLSYPCIVYERTSADTIYADDRPYHYHPGYYVQIIDKNPDSNYHEKMASLPYCRFDRRYIYDNLYHDTFNIYLI